jgi:hypothetical protein
MFPSGLVPHVSPPKPHMHVSSSHTFYMTHPFNYFLFNYWHKIWLGAPTMKLFIMQFPSTCCNLAPLWPKYLPQHSILKHPQPMFLTKCERPSFTPIQNNRNNCNTVNFNLYIFHSGIISSTKWVQALAELNLLLISSRIQFFGYIVYQVIISIFLHQIAIVLQLALLTCHFNSNPCYKQPVVRSEA